MSYRQFNSTATDLQPGVNLIEASAGTGKTYAIAMLALRFIVEKGMTIDELLIVTFTKAATAELKERVRLRLSEAKRFFAGYSDGIDSNIINWASQLDIDYHQAGQRVEMALLDIDRAGVFTIHGFCQRVLTEHALESGQLFGAELSSDVSAIHQACADDFWRLQVYPRPVEQAAVLLDCAATPDELLKTVNFITADMPVYPAAQNLDDSLNNLFAIAETVKAGIVATALVLKNVFADEMFKSSYCQLIDSHWQVLQDWAKGQTQGFPAANVFELLTEDGILQGLNGVRFKTNKTHSAEQRKLHYLQSLDINPEAAGRLLSALKQVALNFRRSLLEYINETLQQRLQQLNLLSFDELIIRLGEALRQDSGEILKTALRQRFKAALIDEFQDTDSKQWFIFSTLFAGENFYLFLIGDPKQAIYKFRGADIFSYFTAQRQAQHLYTLDHNWRSHPSLVKAVNILFQQRQAAFLFEQLTFKPVKAALAETAGFLSRSGVIQKPMVIWQLDCSGSKTGYWTSGKAGAEIQIAVVNEILQLLDPNEKYLLQRQGEPAQALAARDIAILVRTHDQARQYQDLLRQTGIPSVVNSTESVFNTPQAQELYLLLQAIVQPGDVNPLKQALTLRWFNLDGAALYQISNDESRLDQWLMRFQGYYHHWRTYGLMAMMLRLLEQERILENMAQSINAERELTNLHHLLELLQQAAIDEHLGINKTLDWLQNAITEPSKNDELQLRLESDEQAVRIVTMHSCKGLEYPLVFCPCLWQRNNRLNNEKQVIKCHEQGRMIADLGSEDFERRRKQALYEELAEDLRVFYVALTRAKYRCYIIWADVRSGKKRNDSAMDYLLFNRQESTFDEQRQTLLALCNQDENAFIYRTLTAGTSITGSYQARNEQQQCSARQTTRRLATYWQMSSYTALSALSLSEAPELPQDKVLETQVNDRLDDETESLPKGTHTGNVVHALLETIDFKSLAEGADISQSVESACLRYGLHLQQPRLLQNLLQHTVQTPLTELDNDFYLANIDTQCCCKEMPFYLSLELINTRQINELLQGSPAFQPLTAKQMQGYLTGFIDLVCRYRGRYYVMDYKTNSLAGYRRKSLAEAMYEHNYGLQYWIYTLVLHRYLQQRLPDYHYETHFGGVRYLFVRGMQMDKPMSGVYQDYPDFARLQALAELIGGERRANAY